MLLPPALVYVVGGLGAAALVGMIAYDRRSGTRKWVARSLIAVMAIAGSATLVLLFGAARVVHLTGDRTVAIDHALLLGSSTVALDGHDVELPWKAGATLVINQTSLRVQIEAVFYGTAGGGPSDLITVEPGTIYTLPHKLDHIGPEDLPPDEMQSKKSSETRYWLTW